MKNIFNNICVLTVLIFSTMYPQSIYWKQFKNTNSGYENRFNKSIAILGDSLLVPSKNMTIFEISKGNWKTISFNPQLKDSLMNSLIALDQNNHVWFLLWNYFRNELKLLEYDWNTSKSYSIQRNGNLPFTSFEIDKYDNKWITSIDDGLYRFNKNGWANYDTTNSNIHSNHCTGVYINNIKNEIWIATEDWDEKNPYANKRTSFSIYNGNNWSTLYWKDIGIETEPRLIREVSFDKNGNAWIMFTEPWSVLSRVVHYNGLIWEEIIPPFSNDKYFENAMGIDQYNNKWFTYYLNSQSYLLKYDDHSWFKYPIEFGYEYLVENEVHGRIRYDKHDQKWFMNTYSLIVFKEDGLISDAKDNNNLPHEHELGQNYPNPFNPSTTIRYQIPVVDALSAAEVPVTLKVFDFLGREVATLVDEFKQPGTYNSTFSIINYPLPSGVYFYTMQAGSFTETKKFVLMKLHGCY